MSWQVLQAKVWVDPAVTASRWPAWTRIRAEHGTCHGPRHVAAARPGREDRAHADANGDTRDLSQGGRDPDPGRGAPDERRDRVAAGHLGAHRRDARVLVASQTRGPGSSRARGPRHRTGQG